MDSLEINWQMEQQRRIPVQKMSPARRIVSRLERTDVKLNVSNAGNVGKNELDSHADTICARKNCMLMYYINRTCNVMPHSESYDVKTDVPIITACTVYQCPNTGQVNMILAFNEANAGNVGKNELDSHADTICFRKNCMLMYYTNHTWDVMPHSESYDAKTDIPINTVCTIYQCLNTGQVYMILVLNKALLFSNQDGMDHTLVLNPFHFPTWIDGGWEDEYDSAT